MSSTTATLPDEHAHRFIAVLNGKIEVGRLMNALGHMSAGLVSRAQDSTLFHFLEYRDLDGGRHPAISHYPFIVLKADNSSQLRKVRQEAIARGVLYTDFTETMTAGTSRDQIAATAASSEEVLNYFGVCLFGETTVLREFTKKFSLFKV